MRRLPLFFLLDCSESMAGESLRKMEDGLQMVIKTLRSDPHALESVYISVIAFAGVARTIVPLVEISSFYMPKLPLGSGTNLGAGLNELMSSIDKSIFKTTHETKGDWKPLVYLFTDGRPTINPDFHIDRWINEYSRNANLISISLGKNADFDSLKKLSSTVLVFEETQENDYKKFMNWISASVVSQSKSISNGVQNSATPKFDDSVMRIAKDSDGLTDDSCVTLIGRCQKNKRPYIIKYDREISPITTRDFKFDVSTYHLSGCFPLEEDYFNWSDNAAGEVKVNTSYLFGSPGCPHCGNVTAFAVCSCGKLLCVNGPDEVSCPWCEQRILFGKGTSNEDGGIDVGRSRG
jgi:uncharacterized protein YegL